MVRRSLACLATFAGLALHAAPARAELVYFSTGRSLSVKSHRTEGETTVLTLRAGGEMVCETAVIARIEPDEVPYPDPVRLKADPTPETPDTTNESDVRRVRLKADLVAAPRYDPIIERVSAQHGVSASLVRAVIQVESAYQHRARSPKGAMGLMQLMPATARDYSVADPYDPESNIQGGTRYLKTLLDRLPLPLALAAYNAGEAAVQRFGNVPPYPETRQYVARILALLAKGSKSQA